MKTPLDFSILERAGLTQQEFAKLVGVTRVTVNHWVNGGTPANFLKKVVRNHLVELDVAVSKGWLPSELVDIPASEAQNRQEKITDVLERVVMLMTGS